MVKIKYTINEYSKQIYVVTVPNNYIRAMLFLRIQEFYESKSKKFRGKSFSFWDYKEWYSSINDGSFTYTRDWSGFNFPLESAIDCQKISKIETPYDEEAKKIITIIKRLADKNSYVIGVKSQKGETFRHEIAHAFYHTKKDYRKKMDLITSSIEKKCLKLIKNKLKRIGYCSGVINDEIQAYISTGGHAIFLPIKINNNVILKYKKTFNKEHKIIKCMAKNLQ